VLLFPHIVHRHPLLPLSQRRLAKFPVVRECISSAACDPFMITFQAVFVRLALFRGAQSGSGDVFINPGLVNTGGKGKRN